MKKAIIDSFMYVLILAAIQIVVGTVTKFISQTADVTPTSVHGSHSFG